MRPSFLFKEINKFLELLQGNYKSVVYVLNSKIVEKFSFIFLYFPIEKSKHTAVGLGGFRPVPFRIDVRKGKVPDMT